jgi:hypothetical protein
MPFEQRELIHYQAAQRVPFRLPEFPPQASAVDIFNGVPVQTGQLCHMLNRQ